MPAPIALRSKNRGGSTSVRWWPAVAKLQAASVPIAMGQTDRQTDGPQYRLMSRTVGQGIVIFFIHQRVVGKQQYTKK